MAKLETLRDIFLDEVRDLYSAENQLLKALPKLEKKASNPQLKEAFRSHLEETQGQVKRLEEIGKILDEKMTGKTCAAMKGLCEEGAEILEEESDNDALIDALLIGAAQRVEHYEMAGYGTARAMAEVLGEDDIVALLQETLDEEGEANKKLTEIAEGEVLEACNRDVEDDDDSDDDEESTTSSSRSSASSQSARNMKGGKSSGTKS